MGPGQHTAVWRYVESVTTRNHGTLWYLIQVD